MYVSVYHKLLNLKSQVHTFFTTTTTTTIIPTNMHSARASAHTIYHLKRYIIQFNCYLLDVTCSCYRDPQLQVFNPLAAELFN